MSWSSSIRRVGPLLIEALGVLPHKFNGASQVAMYASQQQLGESSGNIMGNMNGMT